MRNRIVLAAIAAASLYPATSFAHNAGASELITVNGATPTDKAHDAVRSNGRGKHPGSPATTTESIFDDPGRLDRNPNAND